MSATLDQYKLILDAETIDLNRLADLARHGIPSKIRGDVWKFLLTTYRNEKCKFIIRFFFFFVFVFGVENSFQKKNIGL